VPEIASSTIYIHVWCLTCVRLPFLLNYSLAIFLGILVFIGLCGTYLHANNTVKRQVALKVCICLHEIIIFIKHFIQEIVLFIYKYIFSHWCNRFRLRFNHFSFMWRQGHHNSLNSPIESGPCSGKRQTLRVVTARDLTSSSVVLLRPPYNIEWRQTGPPA